MPIVFASIIVIGPGEVVQKIFRLLQEQRIWIEGNERLKEEDQEQVIKAMIKWFGKRVIWGGIEASNFIQVFYRLIGWLEEYRRGG